eukprot:1280531-Pyramimonas_sp.AAC.1
MCPSSPREWKRRRGKRRRDALEEAREAGKRDDTWMAEAGESILDGWPPWMIPGLLVTLMVPWMPG